MGADREIFFPGKGKATESRQRERKRVSGLGGQEVSDCRKARG